MACRATVENYTAGGNRGFPLDRFFDDVAGLRPQLEIETLGVGERVALFSKPTG